jgi:hypothetical protein
VSRVHGTVLRRERYTDGVRWHYHVGPVSVAPVEQRSCERAARSRAHPVPQRHRPDRHGFLGWGGQQVDGRREDGCGRLTRGLEITHQPENRRLRPDAVESVACSKSRHRVRVASSRLSGLAWGDHGRSGGRSSARTDCRRRTRERQSVGGDVRCARPCTGRARSGEGSATTARRDHALGQPERPIAAQEPCPIACPCGGAAPVGPAARLVRSAGLGAGRPTVA